MHCALQHCISDPSPRQCPVELNEPSSVTVRSRIRCDDFVDIYSSDYALITVDVCYILNYICEAICEQQLAQNEVTSNVRMETLIRFDESVLACRNVNVTNSEYALDAINLFNLTSKSDDDQNDNSVIDVPVDAFLLMCDILQVVCDSTEYSGLGEKIPHHPYFILAYSCTTQKNLFPTFSSPLELKTFKKYMAHENVSIGKMVRNEFEILSPILSVDCKVDRDVQTENSWFDLSLSSSKTTAEALSARGHNNNFISLNESGSHVLTSVSNPSKISRALSASTGSSISKKSSLVDDLIDFSRTLDSFQNIFHQDSASNVKPDKSLIDLVRLDVSKMIASLRNFTDEILEFTNSAEDDPKARCEIIENRRELTARDVMLKKIFEKLVLDYCDDFLMNNLCSKLFEFVSHGFLKKLLQNSSEEYLLLLRKTIDREIYGHFDNNSSSFSLDNFFEYLPQYLTSVDKLSFIEKFLMQCYPEIFNCEDGRQSERPCGIIETFIKNHIADAFDLVEVMQVLLDKIAEETVTNITLYTCYDDDDNKCAAELTKVGEMRFESADVVLHECNPVDLHCDLECIGNMQLNHRVNNQLLCVLHPRVRPIAHNEIEHSSNGEYSAEASVEEAILPTSKSSEAADGVESTLTNQYDGKYPCMNSVLLDYDNELKNLQNRTSIQFKSVSDGSFGIDDYITCDWISSTSFPHDFTPSHACRSGNLHAVPDSDDICKELLNLKPSFDFISNKLSALESALKSLGSSIKSSVRKCAVDISGQLDNLSHRVHSFSSDVKKDSDFVGRKLNDLENVLTKVQSDGRAQIVKDINAIFTEMCSAFGEFFAEHIAEVYNLCKSISEENALRYTVKELEAELLAKQQSLMKVKTELILTQQRLCDCETRLEKSDFTIRQLSDAQNSRINAEMNELMSTISKKLDTLNILPSLQSNLENFNNTYIQKVKSENENETTLKTLIVDNRAKLDETHGLLLNVQNMLGELVSSAGSKQKNAPQTVKSDSLTLVRKELQNLGLALKSHIESETNLLERFNSICEMNKTIESIHSLISGNSGDEKAQYFKQQVESAVNACCERLSSLLYKFSEQLDRKSVDSVQRDFLALLQSELRKEMHDVNKTVNATLKKDVTHALEKLSKFQAMLIKNMSHSSTQTICDTDEKERLMRIEGEKLTIEMQLNALEISYEKILKEKSECEKKQNEEMKRLSKDVEALQHMVSKLYEKNRSLNEQLSRLQNQST